MLRRWIASNGTNFSTSKIMELNEIKNIYRDGEGNVVKIIPVGNGGAEFAKMLTERLGVNKVYCLRQNRWIHGLNGNFIDNSYGLAEKDFNLFNAYNYLEDGMEMVGYDGGEQEEGYEYLAYSVLAQEFFINPHFGMNKGSIYARRKKAEEKPELVIKVGKRYVTRGGKITLPIRSFDNPCFPFTAIVDGSPFSWTKKGKLFNDSARAAFDLIKEYTPPANTININGYDVPQPVREPLAMGELHYIADITYAGKPQRHSWEDDVFDYHALKNGLIHLTKKAVKKHNKALKSFTKLNK